MIPADEFAARYVAVWNEPDPVAREAAVAGLWRADAQARTGAHEYLGRDAIAGWVTASYEKFVAGQNFVFQASRPAAAHHDGLRIHWEMASAAGGEAVSGGVQFLLLDRDGRVRLDYQFTDF